MPFAKHFDPVMKSMGHKDVRTAMRYQLPELDVVATHLTQRIR